jgi:hypothetical protein
VIEEDVVIVALDGSISATLSVCQQKINKIDDKYLNLDWIPSKTEGVGEVIIPETTLTSAYTKISQLYGLSEGQECIVTYNGVQYNTVVKSHAGGELLVFGNESLLDPSLDNTYEPFAIMNGMSDCYIIISDDTTENPTIKVQDKYVYNKLPERYSTQKIYSVDLNLLGFEDSAGNAVTELTTDTSKIMSILHNGGKVMVACEVEYAFSDRAFTDIRKLYLALTGSKLKGVSTDTYSASEIFQFESVNGEAIDIVAFILTVKENKISLRKTLLTTLTA